MFSEEDFNQDNAQRLSVIIMKQMGRSPLQLFRDLPDSQKRKFNRIMNEYIKKLGLNWETKLVDDFNLIVNEDIFNEDFDPNLTTIKNINTDRQILLSHEQEDWIKKVTEETGKEPLY